MIYDHEYNNIEVRRNFCDVSLSCQMPRRNGGAFGSLKTKLQNFSAPPPLCTLLFLIVNPHLEDVHLRDVCLGDAQLEDSRLRDAHLEDACLRNTRLEKARLRDPRRRTT